MRAQLAAAAIIGAVLCVGACSTSSDPAAVPTKSSTSTSATPGPAAVPTTSTPTDHAVVEDEPTLEPLPSRNATTDASAQDRAAGFVRAWARPDLTAKQWWAGVKGFLTPAAAQAFQYSDPGMVPASKVTGEPRVAGKATATSVHVVVPTDAGDQEVLVIRASQNEAWLVATLTGPAGR